MAKILFVVPNIVGDKGVATAPLPGVAYIAGVVRAAGHEVAAQDMRVEPSQKELFKRDNRPCRKASSNPPQI